MSKKEYLVLEQKVLDLFPAGTIFSSQGEEFRVFISGKPKTQHGGGEPKTDVFIKAKSLISEQFIELKISVKMEMASIFVENKVTKKRFNEIFGLETNEQIKNTLYSDIFPNILMRIGSMQRKEMFPLGWKCEIAINDTRRNRVRITVSPDEAEEIYAGNKRPDRFRNAKINNQIIPNSGVVEYMLSTLEEKVKTPEDVLDQLIPIKEYVQSEENRAFDIILTGLNLYIRDEKVDLFKWDGDRPLLIGVIWNFEKGCLKGTLDLENLFKYSGNEMKGYLDIACKAAKLSRISQEEFWRDYETNVLEEIMISSTGKIKKPFNCQKAISDFFKK